MSATRRKAPPATRKLGMLPASRRSGYYEALTPLECRTCRRTIAPGERLVTVFGYFTCRECSPWEIPSTEGAAAAG